MAVEVNRSKRLRKHAVPVVLALFVITMASAIAIESNAQQLSAISHGLTARIVKITPSANGLAEVSLEKAKTPRPRTPNELVDIGRTAQLTINLETTTQ